MSKASGASLIDLQIMWHRLIAVVEEQAQVLLRTAFSPIVRECGDLSAGVFDLKGRMLAQAVTGTPGHVNSMAESVKHFIAHFPIETMKEGDAYITNDPWMGTGHLNDFVVTTPCFKDGKPVALFSCTSHLMDIGGIGFGPDATDVFMEGLYIPMLKLIDQGVVNETLMAMIRTNTRLPIDTEGDTYSLAGCNDVGCERLVEMMTEFGIDTLDALGDYICDRSREAVLAEIAKLPKGTWCNTMVVDGYDAPVSLEATLTISDEGIHVDFDGTSAASRFGINVPLSYTIAYTVFGLGCVVASQIPNNAGSLSPLTVSAPPGAILNAPKPAPVASRHIIGQMLPDVVFGCLRQIIPERVPAEGTSCLWNLNVRGQTRSGAGGNYGFSMAVTSNGGTGARFEGRAVGDCLSQRRARHAGRDRRDADAADLLAQGAASGFRRGGAHPRRPRPDHRGRQRRRCAVRHPGGIRPHRSSATWSRWRQERRGRLCRPEVRQEAAWKRLSAGAAGRPAGGADTRRRRHRRSPGARADSRQRRHRKRPRVCRQRGYSLWACAMTLQALCA